MVEYPETHLGHNIGPAPTSEELGLTRPPATQWVPQDAETDE